jgi:hypothetical protein
MNPIYTTLNKIRACKPCGLKEDDDSGFRKLLNSLGKTTSDDEPLRFSTILESNGVDDALWCSRSVKDANIKEIRLLTSDCAERVLPIWKSWAKIYAPAHLHAPRKAVEATRLRAEGKINDKELAAAATAATDAYYAARAATAATDAYYAARAAAAVYAAIYAADAYYAARAARAAAAVYAADAAEIQAQGELLVKYFG